MLGKSALLQQEVWWSNMSPSEVCQLISGFVESKPSCTFTTTEILTLILIGHISTEDTS